MTGSINLNQFQPGKAGITTFRPLRAVITLVALGALTYGILNSCNVTGSDMLRFFKGRIAAWKMATIIGSLTVTGLAVSIIFYRATREGSFRGDEHWVPMVIKERQSLVDISTLDENQSGTCYAYEEKGWRIKGFRGDGLSEAIGFTAATHGAAPYVALTIAANAVRIVASPLLAYRNGAKGGLEMAKGTGKQIAKGIWGIIRSPFYGLAFFIANLYVLVDPMNGRKIVANIERDWNDGALEDNSCSPGHCWHKFRDGKGFKLGQEGNSAFYMLSCFQPTAKLVFEKGELKKAEALNGYAEYAVSEEWPKDE